MMKKEQAMSMGQLVGLMMQLVDFLAVAELMVIPAAEVS
jgi:hypothetical protein